MELLTKVHLGAIIATMIRELGNWNWENPFCVAIFGFFMMGFVTQFMLLVMKWKPWIISLMLGCLIIALDFMCLVITGFAFDLFGLLEMFFIAALFGAGLAGAVHIFWELFRRRDPEESGQQWRVMKNQEPEEEEKP